MMKGNIKWRGRIVIIILLLSVLIFFDFQSSPILTTQAASKTFTEDFTTTTYMDGTNTNITGWGTGRIQTPRKKPEIISQLDSTFVGEVQCVSVDGNFAYIGTRSQTPEYHLKTIDISDLTNPDPVGSLLVSGQIMRIRIAGDFAYLAVANTGLVVVDISDSTSPTYVTSTSIGGLTSDVSIEGNYAFVVNENEGVKVFDISDPNTPITSSQWHLNLPGTERSIAISGDYAYVPAGTDLRILNISNPTEPISAGNYTGITSASQCCIVGDYLYVADDSDGLVVFDISDPKNLSYFYTSAHVGIFDLAVYGDFLYATNLNFDLTVFSILNPAKPVLLESVDIGAIPPVLDLDGCHAFVAATSKGLKIIEITEPFAPSILSSYDTLGRSYDVSIAGDYAYVADHTNGLLAFNITDPSSLDLVDSYNTPDTAFGVDISGNYAYVTDASSLQIVNITDPTFLTLASSIPTPSSAYSISISGNYAYLANYGSGLYIIDISDPSSPTFAGSYNTPGAALGVEIQGDFAFIADFYGSDDLQIIDISDPTSPTLAGSYNTPDQAYDLMISGNYAFIADYNNGLYIMDISDPTSPTEVSSFDTNYLAQGVFVSGDYVYLTDRLDGLSIIDVSNPEIPILVENINTPGETWEVVVVGDNAYITDYEDGFHVIEVKRNKLKQFHSPCSAQSLSVFSDSSTTISSAIVSSQVSIPENSYIDLFLSADNGGNWEQVLNDTEHVFTNIGHNLKWKAMLNTQNMSNPLVINRIDIVYSTRLVSPILLSPTDGYITENYTPTFSWNSITGATNYLFQLDSNIEFSSPFINETILAPNTDYTLDPYILPDSYYWRVAAIDSEGDTGTFSEIRSILIFEDLSAPIINSPNDYSYQLGTTGHQIVWIPTDSNPSLYNITLDGVMYDEDFWTGGSIALDIDGLGLGTYTFECSVFDLLNHTTSDKVNVSVVPTQPPTIDDVADFDYEEDSTGNSITWYPSDDNPDWYVISLDGILIDQDVWLGGEIIIDIDGLLYGVYSYICTVNDTDGNEISDTVIVTVTDSISPNLNFPVDVIYDEGDTGNNIIWVAADTNPATYIVYKDGTLFDTDTWTSGSSIIISVDGLTVASYNFTIVVFDEAGNSARDEVTVAVTPTVPEFDQSVFFAMVSIAVVFVFYLFRRKTHKKG